MIGEKVTDRYVFFWSGPFSQWVSSPFIREGLQFNTAEQWMMYQKAMLFDDFDMADRIRLTDSPKEQKALGRKVANYDEAQWMRYAYDFVVAGNLSKFSQNPILMRALIESGDRILVEASPFDKRWGIGLKATAPNIEDESTWLGENLLGKAIMEVRHLLLGIPAR